MQQSELQTAYAASALSFVDASQAALASQEGLCDNSHSPLHRLASGAGMADVIDHLQFALLGCGLHKWAKTGAEIHSMNEMGAEVFFTSVSKRE